ncbi:hypothetical protein GPECTOR_59g606 [Gonium pectorale]|uniref:Pherophorin domain-containing protein n=1 Tax=Gonium pectorale TaxID=33097 RepID=A0A150G546_GONPE|nr:hypothetical protein GPECTOR_59g606 [Gonium pectorale]|eukprot:KXZ44999.1 hypothetical protein GPECTOR_59g606 [Gonium pectorale]
MRPASFTPAGGGLAKALAVLLLGLATVVNAACPTAPAGYTVYPDYDISGIGVNIKSYNNIAAAAADCDALGINACQAIVYSTGLFGGATIWTKRYGYGTGYERTAGGLFSTYCLYSLVCPYTPGFVPYENVDTNSGYIVSTHNSLARALAACAFYEDECQSIVFSPGTGTAVVKSVAYSAGIMRTSFSLFWWQRKCFYSKSPPPRPPPPRPPPPGGCFDIDGYVTVAGEDRPGDQIGWRWTLVAAVTACNANPDCAAVNSNGQLKSFGTTTTTSSRTCFYRKTPTVCPDIAGYNAVYDSDATTGVSLTNFNTVYGWTGAASACSSRTACLGFNTAGALFTSTSVQASVGSCFYVKIQGVPSPPPSPPPPLPPGRAIVVRQFACRFSYSSLGFTLNGGSGDADAIANWSYNFRLRMSTRFRVSFGTFFFRRIRFGGWFFGRRLALEGEDAAGLDTRRTRVWGQDEIAREFPDMAGLTELRLLGERMPEEGEMARAQREEEELFRSLYEHFRTAGADIHRMLAEGDTLDVDMTVFQPTSVPLPPSPPPSPPNPPGVETSPSPPPAPMTPPDAPNIDAAAIGSATNATVALVPALCPFTPGFVPYENVDTNSGYIVSTHNSLARALRACAFFGDECQSIVFSPGTGSAIVKSVAYSAGIMRASNPFFWWQRRCFYSKTCFDIDGYVTVAGEDRPGDQIGWRWTLVAAVTACNANPDCAAVNSNGQLKSFGTTTTTSSRTCFYRKTPTVCPDIAGYNAVYDSDATAGVSLATFNTVYGWSGAASACSSRTACLGFNTAGALFTSTSVQASVGSCFYVKIQGDKIADWSYNFKLRMSMRFRVSFGCFLFRRIRFGGWFFGRRLALEGEDAAGLDTRRTRVWGQDEIAREFPDMAGLTELRLLGERMPEEGEMARAQREEEELFRSLYEHFRTAGADIHRMLAEGDTLETDLSVFQPTSVPLPPSPPPSPPNPPGVETSPSPPPAPMTPPDAPDLSAGAIGSASNSSVTQTPNLRAVRQAKQCKPTPKFAWIPRLAAPRFADLYFNQTPVATGARASALVLWLMNRGAVDPPIASVQLIMRARDARPGTAATLVQVFAGQAGQGANLTCPREHALPLALLPGQGLTEAAFRNLTVLGVRIHVGNGTVTKTGRLPHIASVGLRLA